MGGRAGDKLIGSDNPAKYLVPFGPFLIRKASVASIFTALTLYPSQLPLSDRHFSTGECEWQFSSTIELHQPSTPFNGTQQTLRSGTQHNMANRLGLLTPSECAALSPESKSLYDAWDARTSKRPGFNKITRKLPGDRFVGPFGITLHTPAVGQDILNLGDHIAKLPQGNYSARSREITTLVVGSLQQAAYELYAHRIIAAETGISEQDIEDVVSGRKPEGWTGESEDSVVYDCCYELVRGSKELSQANWDRGVKVLGKDGLTVLIYTAGFYQFVCTVLRGFDAKVPESEGSKL